MRSEPRELNATGATEAKGKPRWRVGSRRSAGPETEDWLTGAIAVGGADACGSVGAGAGTEPPTRRSCADETSTVNREATSAARIAWAGLWRPNPPGSKTAPPARGSLPAIRHPAPRGSGGRGPGGETHCSSGDSLTGAAVPYRARN
ncbi:hypothetical protein NDU88_010762 [Pleurodeles waltl]|uniref:Uncharacterized protein n=1 Tax=Pleurodeles waltl TaxID=8319 RepID=A0AAV7S083_PLEWA|nr:hypothetical protein NDU88_010762 [Pleurodeles waltl]